MQIGRAEGRKADGDEHHQDQDLGHDQGGVCARRFAGASDQQQAAEKDRDRGGKIQDSAIDSGRIGDFARQAPIEQIDAQLIDILPPADRDGRRRHPIFQHQAGAHQIGDQLAHRRIGIGIGRSRHRHRRRQFGKAERRQRGRDPGQRKGQHHTRSGLGNGIAEDHEDAGADGAADAEHGELEQGDGASQRAGLARFAGDGHLDGFCSQEPARHAAGDIHSFTVSA